jgi:hypothetical protein
MAGTVEQNINKYFQEYKWFTNNTKKLLKSKGGWSANNLCKSKYANLRTQQKFLKFPKLPQM